MRTVRILNTSYINYFFGEKQIINSPFSSHCWTAWYFVSGGDARPSVPIAGLQLGRLFYDEKCPTVIKSPDSMFIIPKKRYLEACCVSGFPGAERCHGMPSVAQRPDVISFNGAWGGDQRENSKHTGNISMLYFCFEKIRG